MLEGRLKTVVSSVVLKVIFDFLLTKLVGLMSQSPSNSVLKKRNLLVLWRIVRLVSIGVLTVEGRIGVCFYYANNMVFTIRTEMLSKLTKEFVP